MKLDPTTYTRQFRLGQALLASTALRLGLHLTPDERSGKRDQQQIDLQARKETR